MQSLDSPVDLAPLQLPPRLQRPGLLGEVVDESFLDGDVGEQVITVGRRAHRGIRGEGQWSFIVVVRRGALAYRLQPRLRHGLAHSPSVIRRPASSPTVAHRMTPASPYAVG